MARDDVGAVFVAGAGILAVGSRAMLDAFDIAKEVSNVFSLYQNILMETFSHNRFVGVSDRCGCLRRPTAIYSCL